jgi:hypothetical protein
MRFISRLALALLLGLALAAPAEAAFATIDATNSGANAATTTPTLNLPSGIAAGHLLILLLVTDGNPAVTNWNGYTEVNSLSCPASACRAAWAYRVADGTEGASVTITIAASQETGYITLRIGGHGSSTTAPQGASATGTSATPDPPSLTPTGGPKDFLWIEFFGADDDDETATYWTTSPDAYTGIDQVQCATSGTICMIAAAQRPANATTENPGTMAMAASEEWTAITIAVHPGSEGLATCPRTLLTLGVGC